MNRVEAWRLAALTHVDLDAAARMLEDTRQAVFSQMVKAKGDVPISRAETEVRASDAWMRHAHACVEARTKANRARVEAEYRRMLMWEAAQQRADDRVQLRAEIAS